jgi:hypothetical protein
VEQHACLSVEDLDRLLLVHPAGSDAVSPHQQSAMAVPRGGANAMCLVAGSRQMGRPSVMQIDKDQILSMLRQQGKDREADSASDELPDKVDSDKDRGLLSKYGLDVEDLLKQLPGGLGDKLPDGVTKKLDDLL